MSNNSWKQFGGISKMEEFNVINANTVVAEQFVSRSTRPIYQYLNGTFEVSNDLSAANNIITSGNFFCKVDTTVNNNIYANQKLFAEQNGGITNSDIENFENGVNQYLDRGVFDPNFENAHNELLGKRFYIDQVYKFHKNDTLNKSRLQVYNSVLIEEKQY